MNIFEQASREKLRFLTVQGTLSTEDLWSLKLEYLDNVAKSLNRAIKNTEEESFLKKKTVNDTTLLLKFEIVKHIIDVRLQEEEKKKLAKERAIKRSQLIELIGRKELTALESKSADELRKELAELDKV